MKVTAFSTLKLALDLGKRTLNNGQAEKTRRIKGTVNNAVAAGKITASEKDTYKALLGADFINASKLLDGMSGRQSVASSMPPRAGAGVALDIRAAYRALPYRQWVGYSA